jgi:hypothetical protein
VEERISNGRKKSEANNRDQKTKKKLENKKDKTKERKK